MAICLEIETSDDCLSTIITTNYIYGECINNYIMSPIAESIMRKAVKINSDRTCFEAAILMHHYETRAVLVVNREKKPLGILSEKDLVRFAAVEKILPSSMKVSGIMSSHLTIDVNAPVEKVGRALVEKNASALFVTNEGGEVVGMITEREIMASLLNEETDKMALTSSATA